MQNHSCENDFDLHENETECRTHFHMNGFALRLVLKQRHKRTRKWPIVLGFFSWSRLVSPSQVSVGVFFASSPSLLVSPTSQIANDKFANV